MIEQEPVDLRAAYPGCADILDFFEHPLISMLFTLSQAAGYGLDDVVKRMKSTADEHARTMPGGSVLSGKRRLQMDHPDFRRYVAAKLGMM